MDDIIEKQREYDEEYGWEWRDLDHDERLQALQYLVIGLSEEVGEVCGPVKKMLRDSRLDDVEFDFDKVREEVREEVADIQIYLIKLADVLGIDLEEEHHSKTEKNKDRYEEYSS